MDHKEPISMRVRELRAQKNFTVEQMAELLGVSPEEYTKYETGAKQAPFSFYYNLAEHFGMDVSSVISGEAPNLALYTVTRSGEAYILGYTRATMVGTMGRNIARWSQSSKPASVRIGVCNSTP